MKKIIVVEDEYLVRIGICSICNWEAHGFCIVGNASNGQDAMDLIHKHHPDIVLTDLMMDVMDGFELIEECKKVYPEIAIVVLSNYNDYENVRRAMRLGAEDYVLKLTTKPQDLLETLNKISIKTVFRETVVSHDLLANNMSPIRSRFLQIAIERSYSSENSFIGQCRTAGISLDWNKGYVVLKIIVDDFQDKVGSNVIVEPQMLLSTLEHMAEEAFASWKDVSVIIHEKGRLVVLIPSQGQDYEVLSKNIGEQFDVIRENCARFLDTSISAALSPECHGIGELPGAIQAMNTSLMTISENIRFMTPSTNSRDGIRRAVTYISENLGSTLRLTTLASVAAMSECYFSHIFKLEQGIGVNDYVSQQRIKAAKRLLHESSHKVSTIALEVGITNTNYFSSLFKKITGMTPTEYRESIKR